MMSSADIQAAVEAANQGGEEERTHAIELLRQSEERFRLMVESVRDYAIFMLDTEGYVASWNQGAALTKGQLCSAATYNNDFGMWLRAVGAHFCGAP